MPCITQIVPSFEHGVQVARAILTRRAVLQYAVNQMRNMVPR